MDEMRFSCTSIAGIVGALAFFWVLAKSWVKLKMHPPAEPSDWDETGRLRE
jgi:hypothetical protein